jgi:dihydroorotate dehydrogenase
MPIPVIVNLLALSADEAAGMMQKLEGLENVMAVEILVRTEPFDEAQALITAACSGELPVIARVPLTASVKLVNLIQDSGAQAISLGPPRGSLPAPKGEFVSGRMYGSAMLALGIEAIQRFVAEVDLPILGGCGVTTQPELAGAIEAGAAGVQLDYSLWKHRDHLWVVNENL